MDSCPSENAKDLWQCDNNQLGFMIYQSHFVERKEKEEYFIESRNVREREWGELGERRNRKKKKRWEGGASASSPKRVCMEIWVEVHVSAANPAEGRSKKSLHFSEMSHV